MINGRSLKLSDRNMVKIWFIAFNVFELLNFFPSLGKKWPPPTPSLTGLKGKQWYFWCPPVFQILSESTFFSRTHYLGIKVPGKETFLFMVNHIITLNILKTKLFRLNISLRYYAILESIEIRDHWFNTFAKCSEKLTFLTTWHAQVRVRIRG